MHKHHLLILFSFLLSPLVLSAHSDVVTFLSGDITLHGVLYKPEGTGPFPAVIYNHGSAAGMLSKQAFDALGPVFASHGWVFFGPYRRGQGLSASAGQYIGDQIAEAVKNGGTSAGAATMVRLLERTISTINCPGQDGCECRGSLTRVVSPSPGTRLAVLNRYSAPNRGITVRSLPRRA